MLGRYEVIRHLASGGMAQVLLAKTTGVEGFERHCVLKKIHAERSRDEQVVRMFLDEARLAASLHHANIVQVYDIGQERGEYFFAMEYVHGEDLRRLLTHAALGGERIPTEHVITIVKAAAAALHYAHEQRGSDRQPLSIVHRDVSPANILVGYDGNVKVADFGIAKASFRSSETQEGTLKGKIAYMAPEQCLGHPVDRRSDVFALGIVLFELITVRRLFKGQSDFLTLTAIVAGNPPRPSMYRPDIPPELEQIIMKSLALDPAHRFQTADEMRTALDRFAKSAGLRGSSTELADYMSEQFGARPEPWLVDDNLDDSQVDAEFDGLASAVTPNAVIPGMATPPQGSLLARVRHMDTMAGPTTGSGTPMAWSPSPQKLRRRRWSIVAAVSLPLIAAGIYMMASVTGDSGDDDVPAAAAPLPASQTMPSAEVTPPPAPAIVAEPTPDAGVTAEPTTTDSTTDPAAVAMPDAKKPKPKLKAGTKAKVEPKQYDPKQLFPK